MAMAFFALATVPLAEACKVDCLGEVWFADDAAGSGRLKLLRMWWNKLSSTGPKYGYFANAVKTWLVVHERSIAEEQSVFEEVAR